MMMHSLVVAKDSFRLTTSFLFGGGGREYVLIFSRYRSFEVNVNTTVYYSNNARKMSKVRKAEN